MAASAPRVSLTSLGLGLAAAGVGAAVGLAAERMSVGRSVGGHGGAGAEDYGQVHGPACRIRTDDGVDLYVEVDDPGDGADDPDVTVVFSHGYCLTLDSWHYQRKALRGRYRMVFWDQRGHGRSDTGPAGSATIERIGADLEHVLRAVVPDGPMILVGHSMGGMTVMSLAERDPRLFADRVLGVALVSTSAGGLSEVDLGLRGLGVLVQKLAPTAVAAIARTPRLAAGSRRLGSDLEGVLVRRYSFASPVSAELVRFCAGMIASTRVEVISEYLPTFATHDKRKALATLAGLEVLVVNGDADLLTPPAHSEEIVHLVPHAEHVVVRRGGHLLMLEHPDVVTGHLADLLGRAVASQRRHPGGRLYRNRARRTVIPLRQRPARGARGRRG